MNNFSELSFLKSFAIDVSLLISRVHTLMLPVVTDVSELYKTADGGAMATLIAKLAIEKSYSSKLEETRNAIQVNTLFSQASFRLLFLCPLFATRGFAKLSAVAYQRGSHLLWRSSAGRCKRRET